MERTDIPGQRLEMLSLCPIPNTPRAPGPSWAFAAPLLWGAREESGVEQPGGGKREVNMAAVGVEAEPALQRLQRRRGRICPAVHSEMKSSLESR